MLTKYMKCGQCGVAVNSYYTGLGCTVAKGYGERFER